MPLFFICRRQRTNPPSEPIVPQERKSVQCVYEPSSGLIARIREETLAQILTGLAALALAGFAVWLLVEGCR